MDELDACGNPESPLPVHQGGNGASLAFERLLSESSESDTDELYSYDYRQLCSNPGDTSEPQPCEATNLSKDCGDNIDRNLEKLEAIVPCTQAGSNEERSYHRACSDIVAAGDGQSCHKWSMRKSVRELYGKPSWWGDDFEQLAAPGVSVGNGYSVAHDQKTFAPRPTADIEQTDPCEPVVPRRSEVFLIDFGANQGPGMGRSSTSGDLSQCVPDRIRRAFDERERQKKERELQKEQLRRQSAVKLKLPSLNSSVRRTPIRAPVSARSAAPSSTQPCRVSGRPSTTEPMRSRVSSLTSKSTALKSAPVTPRSDFSSRLRLGVKATTTVGRSTGASSTSSPAASKPEGRVSGSQTPCSTNVTVPNRFGIPTASAPKRVPVTRSLAGHKSPELPANPSSVRCHSSAALTPRTAAPAKRTPAKTTASTMKITPPRNQIPAVTNPSASPSAAAPVLSRSTTQRSSIPNRGTRSFMSGTASSGAKCVRTANTHTDHSTASSSRQMSAPVPCNSIKRPVTSTHLRQPGKSTQGRAIASSRSTTGAFADRLSVKFKLDKPKSLDWTSTLMAELEAYEDPKAYLFHRMFQGSELAEAVTDDVFESVISLSFSSSHKTVSPAGANADPDPTLPEEPSQHNSSLPVRCTTTRQKPPNIGNVVTNRLKEVNGRHPGDIITVTGGITTAVNLKEGELSSPLKLTAIPSVVTSSLTSHQNVANSTVCPASPSTISHTSPMLREKPLRITDQADTSELLNYSLIVGASVTSLAPSDAGTYVIAKHHTLTDESFFIHHEPEPDSLTPRGSLVDLLEVPEIPQASSSTDPISADYDPESSQMTRRDLVYQSTGPEYIATSRHLNTDSAVNSNGIVLTDTEDTGISVCSSTHGTKTTFPVAERYQDDLDLNRTAHSLGQLDDSLLVSASIISLAPSCTGTYVLDVDDTLASQGVPPVVIQSREDLLHSVESLSQPRHLADPKSIDDLTPAQGHHSSRSLLWMTTGDQREDYVMIGSPPQLLTPRHVSHFDANGLTVTNGLGIPHEYRGFGTVNKDSNLKSPQPSPKSPEAITSSNRSAPVEANHVPVELHGQSEIFHNIGTAVQSSHRDMNALPSTTSGFNGSQASVASAQFFAQDSTHKVNSDALLSGTQSRSRPSAYPVRLPRPAQSPTLSSESSSPTQQSTTPPFADKLRDHKVSPLLLSSTGTALSVIEPLADIHDCYQALHASVNYLIQQSDGSVGAREQGPPCEKLGHQNLERPMNVLRSLNKWSTTRASIAPIWRNDMIPPLYGTQKFVGRQHCYCLQRQSTASLDSALDGFRDVLASACGNHPVTTTCNGSASVPQPSSPLQAGSRPFPWLFPTENSAQENTSNPPWVHPSTTSGGVQKGSWYVIQPRTSDHSFPSSSTNFHGRDTAGVAATSEPHSAPPPPDSAAACTHVTDSQTLTTQQVTQEPNAGHPTYDSSTYRALMADIAVLSEGIDNLAQAQLFREDDQKHAVLKLPITDPESRCELPDSTTGPLATDTPGSAFVTPTSQRLTASTPKDGLGYRDTRTRKVPDYPQMLSEAEASAGIKNSISDPDEKAMYYTLMVNSIRHLSLKLRHYSDKLIEQVSSERSTTTTTNNNNNNTPMWTSSVESHTSSTDSVSNSTKYALNDALNNMHTVNEQLRIVDRLLFADNQGTQRVLQHRNFLSTLSKASSRGLWSRLQAEPCSPSPEPRKTVLHLRNTPTSVTTGQVNSRTSINTRWQTHNKTGGSSFHLVEMNHNDDDEEYY